jgi:hypothetical protein
MSAPKTRPHGGYTYEEGAWALGWAAGYEAGIERERARYAPLLARAREIRGFLDSYGCTPMVEAIDALDGDLSRPPEPSR